MIPEHKLDENQNIPTDIQMDEMYGNPLTPIKKLSLFRRFLKLFRKEL